LITACLIVGEANYFTYYHCSWSKVDCSVIKTNYLKRRKLCAHSLIIPHRGAHNITGFDLGNLRQKGFWPTIRFAL